MITKKKVFEQLLAEWRTKESTLIGEFSTNISEEEHSADEEEKEWRKKYEEAQ